jgi:hypothetical protein
MALVIPTMVWCVKGHFGGVPFLSDNAAALAVEHTVPIGEPAMGSRLDLTSICFNVIIVSIRKVQHVSYRVASLCRAG